MIVFWQGFGARLYGCEIVSADSSSGVRSAFQPITVQNEVVLKACEEASVKSSAVVCMHSGSSRSTLRTLQEGFHGIAEEAFLEYPGHVP